MSLLEGLEPPTESAMIGDGTTPSVYARSLLDSLCLHSTNIPVSDSRKAGRLWAQSGAMWLSGDAKGPARFCPAPVAAAAQGAWLALSAVCNHKLDYGFDAYRLLGERAAIAGLHRNGRTSAGLACHLIDTNDGTLALNLARESDNDLLPALLEIPSVVLPELPLIMARHSTRRLIDRARLLGLAIAPVVKPRQCGRWYSAKRYARQENSVHTSPLVVDLTSLWAGPLCGQLLAQCGARVIKVECYHRADGARFGPGDFYNLLNYGKESVALNFKSPKDIEYLTRLLNCADIILESARPRGLEQLGILAPEIIAKNPGLVWLSISGYGRRNPMRNWAAYGDDVGVAAGLTWLMGGGSSDPTFCGDAIADPLTGLHAALLAWSTWRNGGGVLLDLPLYSVVAYIISKMQTSDQYQYGERIGRPIARPAQGLAAKLGEDTENVLRQLL